MRRFIPRCFFLLPLMLSTFEISAVIPTPHMILHDFINDEKTFHIESDQWSFRPELFSQKEWAVKRVERYEITDIVERIISKNYKTKEALLELKKTYLEFWQKTLEVAPHFEAELSLEGVWQMEKSINSLFNATAPSNLINIDAQYNHYLSQQDKTHILFYDQYYIGQSTYLLIHELQRDIVIYQYYITLLKSVINDALCNASTRDLPEIHLLMADHELLSSEVEKILDTWRQQKNNLAYLMSIMTGPDDLLIENLSDWNLPDPVHDTEFFKNVRSYDEEQLLWTMRKDSWELKALRHKYHEMESSYWSKTLSWIKVLGVRIGFDQITTEQIASNEMELIQVQYSDLASRLTKELRDTLSEYEESLSIIPLAKKGRDAIEKKLAIDLSQLYHRERFSLDGYRKDIHTSIALDLTYNRARHGALQAKAKLERQLYSNSSIVEPLYEKYGENGENGESSKN